MQAGLPRAYYGTYQAKHQANQFCLHKFEANDCITLTPEQWMIIQFSEFACFHVEYIKAESAWKERGQKYHRWLVLFERSRRTNQFNLQIG